MTNIPVESLPSQEGFDHGFIDLIDAKFEEGAPHEGTSREHEQEMELTSPDFDLSFLPLIEDATSNDATRVSITRPIPAEGEEAAKKWPEWGGYRLSVWECHGNPPDVRDIMTDFNVRKGNIWMRQDIVIGDSIANSEATDINEERALYGAPLTPEQQKELITWIENSKPNLALGLMYESWEQ